MADVNALFKAKFKMGDKNIPYLVELPRLGLEDKLGSFSVNVIAWEQAMSEEHGRKKLSYIRYGHNLGHEEKEICGKLIPSFAGSSDSGVLLENYDDLKMPCSMEVKDIGELEAHLSLMYQVSFAHYTLAVLRSAGKLDCGSSAHYVINSLLAIGYPNVGAANCSWGHTYVILPFLFKKGRKRTRCIIGLDPVSHRVMSYGVDMPRNALYVMASDNFRYTLSSYSDASLFPDMGVWGFKGSNNEGTSSLAQHYYQHYYHDSKDFFRQAFENTIRLNLGF